MSETIVASPAAKVLGENITNKETSMKKTMAIFFLLMSFSQSAFSFELYGSWWKSNQKYPVNIIKFEKDKFYCADVSFSASYSKDGDCINVKYTMRSTLKVIPDGNTIKVTFPTAKFPKDIVYTRISDEEAAKLLQQNR